MSHHTSASLSLELIQEASTFLEGRVRRTPVERSDDLSQRLGVDVWLKLENLQLTGSFKVRGALFVMHRLFDEGIDHVATCSAGNHGRGVAYAAGKLGMRATIFVPSSVDKVKLTAMQQAGADVRRSRYAGYDDTEKWALEESEKLGLPFVSAFDDPAVMAANGGSVAVEVLDQVPDATTFVMPVGGGGHAGGFAFHVKEKLPASRIVLCQHEGSAAFLKSMQEGRAVTAMPPIDTLASGLEGGIGVLPFEILRTRHDDIRLADEVALRRAMRWLIDEHQLMMEGSCAVAIAACLDPSFPRPDGPVVIFLSGRNIARNKLVDVMSEMD